VYRQKGLLFQIVLLGVCGAAAGAPYFEMLHSIPVPGTGWDIAYDGSELWCTVPGPSGATRYELDPVTGAIVSSFGVGMHNHLGLTYDGSVWWNTDYEYLFGNSSPGSPYDRFPDYLERRDASGTRLSEVLAPYNPDAIIHGLAWDGSALWLVDSKHLEILQVDPVTIGVLSSFPSASASPDGIAYDGSYLWVADNGDDLLYKYTTDGTLVAAMTSPATDPYGVTWDGSALWVLDRGTDRIYRLREVVPEPTTLALLGAGIAAVARRRRRRCA